MGIDAKDIIDAIPCPAIVASPVRQVDGSLADLHIVMMNDTFAHILSPVIGAEHESGVYQGTESADAVTLIKERGSLKSLFSTYITGSVPILHLASMALGAVRQADATFYMPSTKKWYTAMLEATSNGLVVLTMLDITRDKEHVQELRKISHRDRLTHLPNRTCAPDALEIAKDTASFNGTKFGVLLADLDNIKDINDMNGQAAGDEVIKAAADVMRGFRNNNMALFNFGSDEFLLIISGHKDKKSIMDTVDDVFRSFAEEGIKASGGVAIYPDDTDDTDKLVQFADMAMGVAKQTGKNKATVFDSTMRESFVSRLTLQKRLTEAVLTCDFKQYYQPQFDVKSGTLRGFEALIRWQDDDGKFVPPDLFIPVAEETRLIIPIGRWVLNTACATLKRWQNKFAFKGIMSINVSPVQMMQESFLQDLADTIKKCDLSPDAIEIEVTEGVMIDNMRQAVQTLNGIKGMGMRVSLDDFGTGYSSLNYLQKLPLNTLKIDKSFINNITDENGVQAKITNSIISMVASMGLDTIAEGVEETQQLKLLRKFNCNTVQGYLQGKPMSFERCEAYLSGDLSALDHI